VARRPLGAAEWAMLDDAGLSPLVTEDGQGEATRAFGVWTTGSLFVVDQRGVIQYQEVSSSQIPRCIMSLVPMQEVVTRLDARAVTGKRG
jgi:alkyl hydroperoxide reductase subunit AhpC